jgi:predicted nuclease with TOPRIM domain
MSKVQEKEATLLNNLSSSEIANDLDSRLRDLEKNIAVAREFIKLADESYSELRHQWNLLHEEVRKDSSAHITEQAVTGDEKKQIRPGAKARSKTKAKEAPIQDEPKSLSSADVTAKPEIHSKRAKTVGQSKKEPEISGKNPDSLGPEKSFQPYRDPGRRRGKTSGRN